MEKLQVLVVDDEPEIRNEIEEFLVDEGFAVFKAGLPSEAFQIIADKSVDICILDIRLPEMSGLDLLAKIKKEYPATEVIMITAHGEMETVIRAMRLGAIDFFNKPFLLKDLDRAIQKTKAFIHFQRTKATDGKSQTMIKAEVEQLIGQKIVGESRQMKELILDMHKIAAAGNSNVLITGESGTGKELIAKGIHYLSPRKKNLFCAVNCASIPEELFESEFFGHTRGAFTGAVSEKAGWFETANRSTLFMDEIGDMKLSVQPKLLRVLDDMQVVRVGSTKKIKIDVRVIAATNQDLEHLVEERLFRPDLYYRLNSIAIHIPPLRERKEDILPLFYTFLDQCSALMGKSGHEVAPDVLEWLHEYHYPGNVRELKHMVERAVIMSQGHTIALNHFIRPAKSQDRNDSTEIAAEAASLKELEKQTIIRMLKKARYIKVQAAKMLNISRQQLDRKIEKYRIRLK